MPLWLRIRVLLPFAVRRPLPWQIPLRGYYKHSCWRRATLASAVYEKGRAEGLLRLWDAAAYTRSSVMCTGTPWRETRCLVLTSASSGDLLDDCFRHLQVGPVVPMQNPGNGNLAEVARLEGAGC